jgi:O-antigen ligase
MDQSFTFLLEVGIAILLLLAALCVKPEYGLFLYGFALGFPDVAIPLGTAINIRVDDALIVFFLLRSLLWVPIPLASGQKNILKWQALLFAVCSASAVLGFARGAPPASYETIKMIGCAAIIAVLPRLLRSERRLRFLVAGLMCAGVALIVQVAHHLSSSSADILSNFHELKSAATFTTWNPNTIGQAAMLLVFAAGVGWIVFPRTRVRGMFWFCLATVFALTPVLVFARGMSLSIAAGYLLFLWLARRWKLALVFLAIGLSALGYLHTVDNELVDGATSVDLATGEGFSHRFDRWDMAVEAIRSSPILGHGFGHEWIYLSEMGSEGRAHNAYMTVWIELGFGGLALLLAAIYRFVSSAVSLCRDSEFQMCGALLLALSAAICLDSMGSSTLYWEKLPTIALSVGVALIGICERDRLEGAAQSAPAPGLEGLPQHSQL